MTSARSPILDIFYPIKVDAPKNMNWTTMAFVGNNPKKIHGSEFVHPWVYPWFVIAAIALGVPGTFSRPTETWRALGFGIAISVLGAATLWFLLRKHNWTKSTTAIVAVLQIGFISGASFVTHALNPSSSFVNGNTPIAPTIDGFVFVFLSVSLSIVWCLTWALVAILVAFHRSYRDSRRLLLASFDRLQSSTKMYTRDVLEPVRNLQRDIAIDLSESLNRLESLVRSSKSIDRKKARTEIANLWDNTLGSALKNLNNISINDALPVASPKPRRGAHLRAAPRWNGRYFSGLVGGLIIGIVAISSGTSVDVSSPGFFIQIPLIMIAFYLSVPSALLLFAAAALTPFLGTNSPAPENFIFFVVIILLAFFSFLQRANEVRQLRNLESLTVVNGSLALELVRFRQQAEFLKQQITSLIHGRIQSVLVVAQERLNSSKRVDATELESVMAALREAQGEISSPLPKPEVDFASAIAQIVNLWDGSMKVSVTADSGAKELLRGDPHAAATVIEVISEGTLNAAKYGSTSRVIAKITSESGLLRIIVTNEKDKSDSGSLTARSSGVGLEFLRKITSELRLVSTETSTTLYAEVPARHNLDQLSSG